MGFLSRVVSFLTLGFQFPVGAVYRACPLPG